MVENLVGEIFGNIIAICLSLSVMISSVKVCVSLPSMRGFLEGLTGLPELDMSFFDVSAIPIPLVLRRAIEVMEKLTALDLSSFGLSLPSFSLNLGMPMLEQTEVGLTLCPLFSPAKLVLVLFGACVLLFVLLQLKAVFSITYLVPIVINNM
jgi:hypothetical protein